MQRFDRFVAVDNEVVVHSSIPVVFAMRWMVGCAVAEKNTHFLVAQRVLRVSFQSDAGAKTHRDGLFYFDQQLEVTAGCIIFDARAEQPDVGFWFKALADSLSDQAGLVGGQSHGWCWRGNRSKVMLLSAAESRDAKERG